MALAGLCEVVAQQKPNIILVMTDDQGYGDLGAHGHPFLKTPHLDALHAKSVRFEDFHVSPTCAPTRAALMSGMSPFKVGVTHTVLERERLAPGFKTVADVLKTAGYTTGIFGKWHLGDADEYQPDQRGFDEVFIHGAGGIGQRFPGTQGAVPGTSYFDPIIKHNGTFVQTDGYCTDVFFQQALSWMEEKVEEEKPFFAYIPTNAPHGPFIAPESYASLYDEKEPNKRTSIFFGMITNIDDNMGLLMKKLADWDLEEDTVLIFMTDNGSARGTPVFNDGMRGGKGTVHEGGSRVPFFWYWKGRHEGGRAIETMARHLDVLPTLADLADAELPGENEAEGRSLLPLIDGREVEWPHRYTFFHRGRWADLRRFKNDPSAPLGTPEDLKDRNFAVRDEKWRLVEGELFNLEKDPGETTDVSEEHPEIAATMKEAYQAWWESARPGMVNEGADLNTGKPFVKAFRKQKEEKGIPAWENPNYQ
ncbi:MAG: arylsulfatase [Verrucomicrobiota bacterium JB023]|nr:arylsulfatase [Verrucomicrobiota bacterium JB023]